MQDDDARPEIPPMQLHEALVPDSARADPRNGEPEDELRRLVIAYYPADDEVAVFEARV